MANDRRLAAGVRIDPLELITNLDWPNDVSVTTMFKATMSRVRHDLFRISALALFLTRSFLFGRLGTPLQCNVRRQDEQGAQTDDVPKKTRP
ncbi:MAG: hypothetical protein VX988_11815 [Planctomycetota bacterium]|nr:hypothetical protein [Planctomycetota bacterium]